MSLEITALVPREHCFYSTQVKRKLHLFQTTYKYVQLWIVQLMIICVFVSCVSHGSFMVFLSCVSHAFASVYCCLVGTCWEMADLLAIVGDVY